MSGESGDGAEPEMLVFDEFLWECLHQPRMHPGARLTLNHPEGHECGLGWGQDCFTGAILKQGDEIHRVGEYEAETNSWWARWPD